MGVPWTRQKLSTPTQDVLVAFRKWAEEGGWNWADWDHFHGRERRDLSSKKLTIAMAQITGVEDIAWWAAAEAACELFGFDPPELPR